MQGPTPGPGVGASTALLGQRASGSLSVVPPLSLFQAARTARRDLRLVLRNTSKGSIVVVVFRGGETTMVFSPGDGRSVGELLLAAGLLDRQTVDRLVECRPEAQASLQQYLLERTPLTFVDVQRFLDFQARQRLLDALVWEEGYFQLEEYDGGAETGFSLGLPSFESLLIRARGRRDSLEGLLAGLPAPLEHTLARRRRGAVRPLDPWERDVFAAVDRPMLIPQVIARLLVDDDLVLGAIVRMAERRQLILEPRAAVSRGVPAVDGRAAQELMRDVAAALGAGVSVSAPDVWVLALSAKGGAATRLLSAVGGANGGGFSLSAADGVSGVATRMVPVGTAGRLCLVSARPDALSRGALEGILGRCDALVLVRESGSEDEGQRLGVLRDRVLERGRRWRPLVVGVELGAGLRPWEQYPDAVVGVPDLDGAAPAWLVEQLLGGMLAAAHGRASGGPFQNGR